MTFRPNEELRATLNAASGMRREALYLAYEFETTCRRLRSPKFYEGQAEELAGHLRELGYEVETKFANTTYAGTGTYARILGRSS